MVDCRLGLMVGVDIPIVELQLVIHPPTVREIALMGEADFFLASQYLCLNKETLIKDENILEALTNFQVLMKVLEQSADAKEKKRAIIMLLQILFPDYTPMLTKNSIILARRETQENVLIDANNFDILQSVLREVLCVHSLLQGDKVTYNPANARAKAIADKLMAGRAKVAAMKQGKSNESVLTRYLSVLTIGIPSMSLEQCGGLNLFQVFDLMERYSAYVEWDIDLKVRLAGGKPDKQVETWMRNLH